MLTNTTRILFTGLTVIVLGGTAGVWHLARAASQEYERPPVVRHVTVTAKRYAFIPDRIETNRDDILRITLVAEDVPHGFTIDEYRIVKRVMPGHEVTFEFRTDRPGRFVFYCGMTADERCGEMHGDLVVR
jgi:cytochrome c oxidase subunit 2